MAAKYIASVNPKECVSCGTCVKVCPSGAMSVYKGVFAIADKNRCIGCKKCAKSCPASVISMIIKEKTDEKELL
ncbi:MAG: 4Fe-4S binding protein [Campylobacteraceae bacterium]|jgi:pyruvate formate lyase activating enzyme|nr:4Fe-4S binding protein [Campylobacteraceae bacterium]